MTTDSPAGPPEAPGPPEDAERTRRRDPLDLAQTVLALHEAADSDETIERIAAYSRAAVGCDDAGVMLLLGRNQVDTAGATSDTVVRAHDLQIKLDEGPCLAALEHTETIYRVEDTTTDTQWPRWSAAVADLGYRSVLSVPLATKSRRYGSLNVYAFEPRAFDQDDMAVTMILARHASASLAANLDIEGLRKAVDARKLIGIAMGMIMERYGIDADRAFDVLRRLSQAENIKLRDVARQVVEDRGLSHD
ncbi:GAF and ANTAR domain-containing protein [Aeromicrobium choanae]|uniref:GAF domain-containing protein n=1 Tax=Aeromicrobium choanae TaxID=1736691 RepID=A0A1T4Z8I0_9ACTN|nr:GAF and ANTAR domain-containing protein [Aeromicrobium choanae]SKB10188.1 GAF domain-containing protein [Aeromicrobium choanae]